MANILLESGTLSPPHDVPFFPNQNSNFEYTDSDLTSLSTFLPSPVFGSDSFAPVPDFTYLEKLRKNQNVAFLATLPELVDPFSDLASVNLSFPPPSSLPSSNSSSIHSLPPPSRLFTSLSLPCESSSPTLLHSCSLPASSVPSLSFHPRPLSPSSLSPSSLPPPKRLKIADLAPKLSLLSSDVLHQLLAPSDDSSMDLSFLAPPGDFSRVTCFPPAALSVNGNNNLSFLTSLPGENDKGVPPPAVDANVDLSFLASPMNTSNRNLPASIQSGETKGNLSFLTHSEKNSRNLSLSASALLSLLSPDSNCPTSDPILESRLERDASQRNESCQQKKASSNLCAHFPERFFLSRNESQIRISELGKRQNPAFSPSSSSNCSSVASWKKEETSTTQNNQILSSKRPFSDVNSEGTAMLTSSLLPLSAKGSQSAKKSETVANPEEDPSLFSFLVSDWPKLIAVSEPQTSQTIHQHKKMGKRLTPKVGSEIDISFSFSESPRGRTKSKYSPTSSEILRTFESSPDIQDYSALNQILNPMSYSMSNTMPNLVLNSVRNLMSNTKSTLMSSSMSNSMSNSMSSSISNFMSNTMLNSLSHSMPNLMPNLMSNSMPNLMSNSMPNSMLNSMMSNSMPNSMMSNSMPNSMMNPRSNLISNSMVNTKPNWNIFEEEMEGTLAGMVMQQMTPKRANGDLNSQQILHSVDSESFKKREDTDDTSFGNFQELF